MHVLTWLRCLDDQASAEVHHDVADGVGREDEARAVESVRPVSAPLVRLAELADRERDRRGGDRRESGDGVPGSQVRTSVT